MDSPIPEKITVMLDHERDLKYPLPSIFAFEDLTGLPVLEGGVKNAEEFYGGTEGKPAGMRQRIKRICDVLWAGLIRDDASLTREQVEKIVQQQLNDRSAADGLLFIQELDERCGKAFFASLAKPKAEAEKTDPLAETGNPAPSPETPSGESPATI
jgi:hypothetical protein